MPTILIKNGFRFVIYLNDHEPMHVHVIYQGSEAVIEIANDIKLRDNRGLNRNQLRQAMAIAGE